MARPSKLTIGDEVGAATDPVKPAGMRVKRTGSNGMNASDKAKRGQYDDGDRNPLRANDGNCADCIGFAAKALRVEITARFVPDEFRAA